MIDRLNDYKCIAQENSVEAQMKEVALAINENLENLQTIDAETSHIIITDKFSVARSMVADIKENVPNFETLKHTMMETAWHRLTIRTMQK